jgi:hypothetical protein
LRQFLLVLVALLAGSAWLTAASASPGNGNSTRHGNPTDNGTPGARSAAAARSERTAAIRYLGGEVVRLEHVTWRWQNLRGAPLTQPGNVAIREMSIRDAKRALARWQERATTARRQAEHPPHLAAWLCIHRYEGSWTDAGAPFYGGLQMDLGFQRTYGSALLSAKGTADHWAPLEQMWVAEKALRAGRGFYPWPNSARMCGLI